MNKKIDLTMAPSTRIDEYVKQALDQPSTIEILGAPKSGAEYAKELADMQMQAFGVINDHLAGVLTQFQKDVNVYTKQINALVNEQKKVINLQADRIHELEFVLDAVIKMTMFDAEKIPAENAEQYKAVIAKFLLRNKLLTVQDTETSNGTSQGK